MKGLVFTGDDRFTGPRISKALIARAQKRLGCHLPDSYVSLLKVRNGGVPYRRCFPTTRRTSWARDHIQIEAIRGIGGEWGIDDDDGLGSADMIKEWGYPDIGIVICHTPSGGHDTVMFDYRSCGPHGEPQVVYIDEDRSILTLADNFSAFVEGLYACRAAGNRTGVG